MRAPGRARGSLIASLGREAQIFARAIEHRLPSAYEGSVTDDLIAFMGWLKKRAGEITIFAAQAALPRYERVFAT